MKIVVVGAKGMLGGMLMEIFKDLKPVGLDRGEIDIVDRGVVDKVLGELHPEVIVNAAAYTEVDRAEQERELAFEVNEVGVKNLAGVARKLGAKLVHYSTDYVFPAFAKATAGKPGYSEDEEPGPAVNVYGESKLAGERALQAAGIDYYLIRTAWLYGPGGKNFVETMLKLGQEKPEVRVVNDQFGSPTFTKDVAEFTKSVLQGEYELGVYHAVNAGVASWSEFAEKIFEIANREVRVVLVTGAEFPRPARRPRFSVLKNTKGPSMRDWSEAVDEYIKVYYKEGL
jgi:dTDP-4-dehydrorhamnose reductase